MNKSALEETRVGKIVARQPSVARIFEKHQIDYCCRGNTTLAEACDLQQINVADIVEEIQHLNVSQQPNEEADWNSATLTELADHIVETHHEFLKTELPRISELTAKVNNAHGEKRPELTKVMQTFTMMRNELEEHMAKEENILFPAIRMLESKSGPIAFPFGSVTNPIAMMEHEHDDAGGALRRLRELTGDYVPPADACPTYRVMLESLLHLEQDLHLHIHKENNILFPAASEKEKLANAV